MEASEIVIARRVKGTVRSQLSLFMGKVRVALPIYSDVTHVCGNRPTHAAHVTRTPPRHAWVVGSAAREKFHCGKNRPACPRTVLGLAQQRIALMCGPGPGALVGVQK